MFAHTSIWWPWGALIAAWIIGNIVLGVVRARNRTKDIATEAQALGLTFTAWTGPDAAPQFDTPFFRSGSTLAFKNMLTGVYGGLEVSVFDYSRSAGSASNSTGTVQTVAAYTTSIDLPAFGLGPGGLAGKIIDAIEHQNVDLDADRDFSRRYSVRGPDKERIKSLFTTQLIGFLKELDRSKAWQIEGGGKTLIIYRYARKVKPKALRDFLQETSFIAQSFCAYAGTTKSGVFSASSNH